MPYRVVLFFNQPTLLAGWSETYFNTLSDRDQVVIQASNMARTRMRMSPIGTFCSHLRVSDVDPPRDSSVDDFRGSPLRGEFSQTAGSDLGWTSLLVSLVASPYRSGRKFLRGVPDLLFTVQTGVGVFSPNQRFKDAFTAYSRHLTIVENGWAIRNRSGISYIYNGITAVKIIRTTSHRVGRPFGQPVGRRT